MERKAHQEIIQRVSNCFKKPAPEQRLASNVAKVVK